MSLLAGGALGNHLRIATLALKVAIPPTPPTPPKTTHRYWRLHVLDQTGLGSGFYIRIADVELRATPGGPDLTGSGTASASSTYIIWPFNLPAKAFDDDLTTEWSAAAADVKIAWLQYDFGVGNDVEVQEVQLRSGNTGGYAQWTDWDLLASDDEIAWIAVAHFRGQAGFSGSNQTIVLGLADAVGSYEAAPHGMAQNPAGMYSATASSYDLGADPWRAFDATTYDQAWGTDGSAFPQWLQIDLGYPERVTAYSVKASTLVAHEATAPKDWTLRGSHDGAAWDTVDVRSGQTGWGVSEIRTFSIAAPDSYRYYRMNVSASNGNAVLVITELDLAGVES